MLNTIDLNSNLIEAAKNNDLNEVKALVEQGADAAFVKTTNAGMGSKE
jgi:hypothetical protein